MVRGIGIDICSVERIRSIVEADGPVFLDAVFTRREVERFERHALPFEHLAGVFAAKEAVFKCFSIGWDSGVSLREVEVEKNADDAPTVVLSGRFAEVMADSAACSLFVTISHDAGVAVAVALLED